LEINGISIDLNLPQFFLEILAEFKDDVSNKLEFDSLNSLAKRLKGDGQVIRDYLKTSLVIIGGK